MFQNDIIKTVLELIIFLLIAGLITVSRLYIKTRIAEKAKSAEARETNRQLEALRSQYAKELEDVKAKSARELEEFKKNYQLEISVRNKQYDFKRENYVKFLNFLNEILYKPNEKLGDTFSQDWFYRMFSTYKREDGNDFAKSEMFKEFIMVMAVLLKEAEANFQELIKQTRTVELIASEEVKMKIQILNDTYIKLGNLANELFLETPEEELFEVVIVSRKFTDRLSDYNNTIDNTIKDLIGIMNKELKEI